jgi:hypothetical protein
MVVGIYSKRAITASGGPVGPLEVFLQVPRREADQPPKAAETDLATNAHQADGGPGQGKALRYIGDGEKG